MQDLIIFTNHHPFMVSAAGVLLILLTIVEFLRLKNRTFLLNPQQTTQMINHDHAVIIDIRGNEQFRLGHIIDAHAIAPEDIQKTPKKIERFKNKPLIFVCNTGVESQKLAAQMLKQGYNAYALSGGIRAWLSAPLPLVKE